MPVLIRLTQSFFPGNPARATTVPTEIPMKRLISVARSGNLEGKEGDPQHLRIQGDQELEGLLDSFKNQIHLFPQVLLLLARIGEEERRAVFVHAEGLDDVLGFLGDHEIGKGLCPGDIHLGPFGRVDFDDMIDVEKDASPSIRISSFKVFSRAR